jgi:hypothetical protein
MNYQVQFEVPSLIEENVELIIGSYKKDASFRLGEMISGIIGFNEIFEGKHLLQVVAFSYKDWSEFKQDLKSAIEVNSQLGLSTFNLIQVGKMIQKLENAGEEKTAK